MDDDPAAHARVTAALRAAGCVYAEDEATLLLQHAGGTDELDRLVSARAAGRPLEHLLGWAELDGLRVMVDPGVFVPRARSVLLVDVAAREAPRGGVVVDLCCGSGGLLALLLHRRPDLEGWAADVDPAAVACARRNLAPDRVLEGDLDAPLPDHLRGRVDVLLANAPYVPTDRVAHMPGEARDHEHRVALDGGGDGLDLHRRLVPAATRWLGAAGVLVVEVAPPQVATARRLCTDAGLRADVVVDDDRDGTAVVARRPLSRRPPPR